MCPIKIYNRHMTITINGKKQPFTNFIKSEQEFIDH